MELNLNNISVTNTSKKTKWILFIKLILCLLIIQIVFTIFSSLLIKDPETLRLLKMYSDKLDLLQKKNGILMLIFSSLVLAPIVEESLFRSWIVFKDKGLKIFITVLFYFLFKYIFSNYDYWLNNAISISISLCIYFIMTKIKFKIHFNAPIKLIIVSYILSSFLFGIVHLFRTQEINSILFILIIPHIIYGFLLGYIRLKNGLIWAMSLHFLINIFPAISLLIHYYK